MKKSSKFSLALVLAALTVSLIFLTNCPPSGVQVGLPAPEIKLERLGGGEVTLSEQKGKVVLVNFWATWCAPCKDEIPDLEKLHRNLEGKSFILLAISVDLRQKTVADFAREQNISFPVLLDSDAKIARSWGTSIFPESYIIDKKGIITKKIIGQLDYNSTLKKIQELMGQ